MDNLQYDLIVQKDNGIMEGGFLRRQVIFSWLFIFIRNYDDVLATVASFWKEFDNIVATMSANFDAEIVGAGAYATIRSGLGCCRCTVVPHAKRFLPRNAGEPGSSRTVHSKLTKFFGIER